MQSLVSQSEYREKSTWGLQENLTRYVSELTVYYRSVNVSLYYLFGVAALTLKGLDPQPTAPCISIMACLCSISSVNLTKPYPLQYRNFTPFYIIQGSTVN